MNIQLDQCVRAPIAAIGACMAMAIASYGQAATPAPTNDSGGTEVEEIVVTGTSIRGIKAVGQPAIEIGQEEMRAAGVANLSQLSRTLPVVLNIGPDESRTGGAQDAAANSTRISAINLRGLGPEASLMLVNGRRIAPGGVLRALSDPSMISAGATERLEVVLDGNSAVYGADAVAGVVNIITRRNFNGAETRLRYGPADGMNEKSAVQSLGKTWNGGDAFVTLELYDRSNLARSDREFLTADLRPYGGTDQRSTQARVPNLVVSGVRLPYPTYSGASNRYDLTEGDFLPQQRRFNAFWSVRQQLNQDVQLWYEGFMSSRRIRTINASLGGSFAVPTTNAFYSLSSGAPGPATRTVEYRLPRAGATSEGREIGRQNAIGLKWTLPAKWELNAYYSHSTDRAITGIGGEQINNKTLPLVLADSNPATALNVFGGAISQTVYDRFIAFRNQKNDAVTDHVEAKFDGPLFALAGGEVRAAAGVSYDKASLRYQEYQNALSATNTPSTTNDKTTPRNITSGYSELFLPIVSDANARTGVQRLDVSLAARYDRYSDFGTTTNPKVAVVLDPVKGVSLRATWGKSFRAPSLVDTGNLNFVFIANVADPANGNAQITQISITGSNPNLKPERAETYSYGIDFQPTFLEGFTTSLTYYHVSYKDRILGIAASLANEALYRQFVVRNPSVAFVQNLIDSGWLVSTPVPANTVGVYVDQRRNNIGTLIQDGLDVDIRYRKRTQIGELSAALAHSKIYKVTQTTGLGQTPVNVVDTINNPIGSRGRLSLGWMKNEWSANVFYNYAGSYLNTAVVPNETVQSQKTTDIGFAYNGGMGNSLLKGLRVGLNVQNVGDTQPPIVINGANAWDNTTASGIGRFYSVDISKTW